MGIARNPASHVIKAAQVIRFIGERNLAEVFAAVDPFGLDNDCEVSPNGQHQAVGSCGDVVCCHCAKIFWG